MGRGQRGVGRYLPGPVARSGAGVHRSGGRGRRWRQLRVRDRPAVRSVCPARPGGVGEHGVAAAGLPHRRCAPAGGEGGQGRGQSKRLGGRRRPTGRHHADDRYRCHHHHRSLRQQGRTPPRPGNTLTAITRCWLSWTGPTFPPAALAGLLRPGNAGSNTAADHVTVLTEALAALPPAYRPDPDGEQTPDLLPGSRAPKVLAHRFRRRHPRLRQGLPDGGGRVLVRVYGDRAGKRRGHRAGRGGRPGSLRRH